MRYDTPMYIQTLIPGKYNKATGNYDGDKVSEDKVMASVMSLKDETVQLLFGKLRDDCLVAHTQRYLVFNRVRIGAKTYEVIKRRKLRHKGVYYLQEV